MKFSLSNNDLDSYLKTNTQWEWQCNRNKSPWDGSKDPATKANSIVRFVRCKKVCDAIILWFEWSCNYTQIIFLSLVNISSPHQPTLTGHGAHVNGLRRVTFSKFSLPILLFFGLKLDGCWTIIVATSHIYANS